MKSKKIPVDIKSKSIKEAQNEIKEIIENIHEQFKKKAKEIKQSSLDNKKKPSKKV